MGLLKLLTFPVSVPVAGGKWVLKTILDQAERQHYDVGAIQQQMAELAEQYQAGLVSDSEFDRREEELLERLLEAREHHERKAAQS